MVILSPKERVFVDEYLSNGNNATAAYKVANPKVKNDNVAGVEGHKMLRHPKIQALVDRMINSSPEEQAAWMADFHGKWEAKADDAEGEDEAPEVVCRNRGIDDHE